MDTSANISPKLVENIITEYEDSVRKFVHTETKPQLISSRNIL